MRYSRNEMSLARSRTVTPKIKSSLLNDYIEFCLKNKDSKTAVLAFVKRNGRELYFVDNRFVDDFIIERGFCLSLENNIERVLKHLRVVEKDSMKLRDSINSNSIKSFFNNNSSRTSSLFNKLNDSCVELSQVVTELNSDILDFNNSQNYINELRDVVGCYLCDFVDGEIIKTDKESYNGYSINNFYLKDILENLSVYITNRIRTIASAVNVNVNRFFISVSQDNLLNIHFYNRIGFLFKNSTERDFSNEFEQVDSMFSAIGFQTTETNEYRVFKELELLSQKGIELFYDVVINGGNNRSYQTPDVINCYIYLACNE